jgi:hypothetical protein
VYELEFDNGQGVKTDVPLAFELADLEPWTAGKAIEYKLLIRGEFIRIDTSLWPWETGSDTNIDGNL